MFQSIHVIARNNLVLRALFRLKNGPFLSLSRKKKEKRVLRGEENVVPEEVSLCSFTSWLRFIMDANIPIIFFPSSYCNSRVLKFSPDGKQKVVLISNAHLQHIGEWNCKMCFLIHFIYVN